MVLKIIAFEWIYFSNGWNRFDFFDVIAAIFDIILKNLNSTSFMCTLAENVIDDAYA